MDRSPLDRTVAEFIAEMDHIRGFKVRFGRSRSGGTYLESPSGERISLGDLDLEDVLSPRAQEGLCEGLGFVDQTDLGLDPRQDD